MLRCTHCGEPVPPRHARPHGEPSFCCVGCEAIHHALGEAGLGDFYRYKDLPVAACPIPTGEPVGHSAPVRQLMQHARPLSDGTFEVTMHLEGVHCAGCVWLVEQMPRHLDGALSAQLELARARLHVRWDPEATQLEAITAWLERFGYGVFPPSDEQRTKGLSSSERALLQRVGVSWALAGNIMLLSAAMYSGLDLEREPAMASAAIWAMCLMATGALCYGGDVFLKRGWGSIVASWRAWRAGQHAPLSMDVPLALGVSLAYAASVASAFTGAGEVWFDSMVTLIAALLTARWIQQRASRLAREATARLMALLPQTARRIGANGSVEEIDATELHAGDLVEVRSGDVVPADGAIVFGTSTLDRSVLTGESRHARVGPGARVSAGVTNVGGVLRVEVAASGAATRVVALIEWIEERATQRAPLVQMADRAGGVFVALVLLFALLTGIVWATSSPERAVINVVAVLVVSCPCALSMATPLALAIFVARAARRGIFVKHDDVIESIARAHTMVLDKTGTLTEGRMAVLGWHGATSAVHLAAALERHSAHPIAEALVRLGDERGWSPLGLDTDVTDVPGKGLTGVLEEQEVCVGRIDWLLSKDDTPKEVLAFVDEHVQRGHTPIAITVDGSFGAVVALGDPVRPEAPALLETLRARGITPIIASGDHEGVVRHVGASLGLPEANIHGAMSPEDKLALIESLKRPGEPVVMVGDGVNDAAAMQAADIGVAVPGGAQASFVAADVFLTRGGLAGVVSLIVGSERTLTTIRRNLTGSALYNAFGITLAALGFVTPLLAAILMPISSVSVVASSLLHRSLPRSAAEVDAKHSDVTGLMPEEVTP